MAPTYHLYCNKQDKQLGEPTNIDDKFFPNRMGIIVIKDERKLKKNAFKCFIFGG